MTVPQPFLLSAPYQRAYPHLRRYDPLSQMLLSLALDLFRRPAPSGQEELVRAYLIARLTGCGFHVSVDQAGNVLAVRGQPAPGEGFPLLSCHMDTVQQAFSTWVKGGKRHFRRKPLHLLSTEHLICTKQVIHPRGRSVVLGGDDKCGIAIALCLAQQTTLPLKICASVSEEIGCLGIRQVDPLFFSDVSYALVLDRREAHDLIISIVGEALCSTDFATEVLDAAWRVGHWALPTSGMMSDAQILSWRGIPNVVNLSVGYYEPHSTEEYVVIEDLILAKEWAGECLSGLPLVLLPRKEDRLAFEKTSSREEGDLAGEDEPEGLWWWQRKLEEEA